MGWKLIAVPESQRTAILESMSAPIRSSRKRKLLLRTQGSASIFQIREIGVNMFKCLPQSTTSRPA